MVVAERNKDPRPRGFSYILDLNILELLWHVFPHRKQSKKSGAPVKRMEALEVKRLGSSIIVAPILIPGVTFSSFSPCVKLSWNTARCYSECVKATIEQAEGSRILPLNRLSLNHAIENVCFLI